MGLPDPPGGRGEGPRGRSLTRADVKQQQPAFGSQKLMRGTHEGEEGGELPPEEPSPSVKYADRLDSETISGEYSTSVIATNADVC